jgi:hypothetical protein
MQRHHRTYWLLAAVVLAGMAMAVWVGREPLDSWTRGRVAGQHARMLAELPDSRAAVLIAQLTDDDPASLDLLVAALGDSRSPVAAAAEAALLDRLDRWGRLPLAASLPRVAALAEALSQHAQKLPEDRRESAQHLAQRLLTWPVDHQTVDPGRLIAHCEVVLRLEQSAPPELHLAAIEARPPLRSATEGESEPAQPQASTEPLVPLVKARPTAPREILPIQPDPLPGAGREMPIEPRRFLPPRGVGSVSD